MLHELPVDNQSFISTWAQYGEKSRTEIYDLVGSKPPKSRYHGLFERSKLISKRILFSNNNFQPLLILQAIQKQGILHFFPSLEKRVILSSTVQALISFEKPNGTRNCWVIEIDCNNLTIQRREFHIYFNEERDMFAICTDKSSLMISDVRTDTELLSTNLHLGGNFFSDSKYLVSLQNKCIAVGGILLTRLSQSGTLMMVFVCLMEKKQL